MRRLLTGVLASAISVALVTAAIALLKPHVPVLSLGVLYVFAVLPIAVVWGIALALPVSVASMLAFEWFYLPPIHRFSLANSENWFALAVYLATAVVVSELAARSTSARRRSRAARARVGVPRSARDRPAPWPQPRRRAARRSRVAPRRCSASTAPRSSSAAEGATGLARCRTRSRSPGEQSARSTRRPIRTPPAQRRFLPALAALLAVAVDRDRLEREALEAETLRRSDLVKTALLRAVSHDLRSPLTGIRTAIGALRNDTLQLSDADRSDLLDTIEVDSDRLSRLVGDLLDLSRLEAGSAAPARELWALDDIVREAVDSLGARDRVEIAGESPLVEVDAAQVQRVLPT